MLDLFLKLVDRLLDLAKKREARQQKWADVVESLQIELKAVHSDYLTFFEQAKADLAKGVAARDVVAKFSEKRIAGEAARRTLQALADELVQARGTREDVFTAYVAALSWYFMGASSPNVDNSSAATSIVREVERLVELGLSGGEVAERFSGILNARLRRLRREFDAVAAAYGKVQASAV